MSTRRSPHLLLFLVAVMLIARIAYAEQPRILITGATIQLDFEHLIAAKSFPLSHDELRLLAVAVTNLYRENGYTTSFAEKVVVRKNGDIEIIVRESRIRSISVQGINKKKADGVKKILNPRPGELFNSIRVKERADFAVASLRLSGMKITLRNHEDSADVSLQVEASDAKIGAAQVKMHYEPMYGLSPVISYNHQLDDIDVSLFGALGIKENEYRKRYAGCTLALSIAGETRLFGKYEWSKTMEKWQEPLHDYDVRFHRPSLGMMYFMNREIRFDVWSSIKFVQLKHYPAESASSRDFSACVAGHYTNAPEIIVPGDDTNLSLSLSLSQSDPKNEKYFTVEFFSRTVISPAAWLNIRPTLCGNYTSSNERYNYWYVYDEAFPVKAGDFSATHARISSAVFFECELYPEILRVGPAVSGSLHYDEAKSAILAEAACGLSTRIFFGRFTINATCFWAAELFPAKPVFLFSANGVF